jgi:hypothetical protein
LEVCEATLAGETPRVAYRRLTGDKTADGFRRFMANPEHHAYCAARRMELRIRLEEEDPAERWLREMTAAAYWDAAEVAWENVRCEADILRLPEHIRRQISGWSRDAAGNFKVTFIDKKAARDMLAKYHGLYQADRTNDKDTAATLLQTVFWRYVLTMHLELGVTIAQAFVEARRDPDKVEAWGKERGLLTAGAGEVGDGG